MNNKHLVRYAITPAVMIQQEFDMHIGAKTKSAIQVRVRNQRQSTSRGDGWIMGVQLDFEMTAKDLQTAVAQAGRISETISAGISLLSTVGLPNPHLQLACDIDPEATEHQFLQVFRLPTPISSRRWIHATSLTGLLQKWERLPEGKRKRLIARSVRLYSRALQFDNPLEEFFMGFLALEALEYPLAEKIGRDDTPGQRLPGVAKLFSKMPQGSSELRRFKDVRDGFAHGKPDVDEMVREAIELTPKLRRALVEAYSTLFGLDLNRIASEMPLRLPEEIVFKTHMVLSQSEPGPLGVGGEPPCFEPDFRNMEVVIDAKHHTQVQGNLVLSKRLAPYVVYRILRMDASGQDIEGVEAHLTLS